MSALTSNNAALIVRDGDKVSRLATASVTVYNNCFGMQDEDGNVRPLSTSHAGEFCGIIGGEVASTDTGKARMVELARKGAFKASISGVAATDLDKPVWCNTDNPADCTLTYAAGYYLVGRVAALEYDSQGTAISGKCWVRFDVREPVGLRALPRGQPDGLRHINGGIEYWNDFVDPAHASVSATAGAAAWLLTMVDGDSDAGQVIKITDGEPDGTLTITTNDKSGDQNSLQINGAHFTPGLTAVVYFEARFKVADVSEANFVIGLCARGGDRYNAAGGGLFFRMDNDDNLDCVTEKSTSEEATDSGVDLVDDTYVVVGILYEQGVSVKFYVNGTLVETSVDTDDIPVATDLVPTIEIETAAAAVATMTVDYILARQLTRV